jgi:hypothetical protein
MRFITIIFLFAICSSVFSQIDTKILIPFSVEQTILPGDFDSDLRIEYEVADNKVTLHRTRFEFVNDSLTTKKEKYYEQVLLESQINRINSLTKQLIIDEYDSIYSRGVIDGIVWVFKFNLYDFPKKVVLDNYYITELDSLVKYVSSLLPKEYQTISLSYGFYEEQEPISDTVIYYLPDFYLKKYEIPNGYKSYRIMCFKKGYFPTKILDSINVCDCRVYPTDRNGAYKKRHYWRAYRIDDSTWNRKYYDNYNNVIKADTIHDIIPYVIVEEKTYIDKGNIPSVTIYRYYKTEIRIE